jgi:hypothetical protein
MRFLECNPEIAAAAPQGDLVISVEAFHRRYRILEEGRALKEVIDTRSLVEHLHKRVFFLSFRHGALPGVLHAASLRRNGRRVLIAGGKGAGKTSLALRLVGAGYALEGDEHVFLQNGGVIARPRGCRVKEPSLTLLPELAAAIRSAPVYQDVRGWRLFNVAPTLIGGSWRIEQGGVDCLIVLHANHGGYSSIRRLSPSVAAQAVMSDLRMQAGDRGSTVAAIAALVTRAKTFDLSLGDYEGAVRCIDRALDD